MIMGEHLIQHGETMMILMSIFGELYILAALLNFLVFFFFKFWIS